MIDKIKLDLFKLKTKEDLIGVYSTFLKNTEYWFHADGTPNSDYFSDICCPLCQAEDSKPFLVIDNFNYDKCMNCGSVYTRPHLKNNVLTDLYSNGAYQAYQENLVNKGKKIRSTILEERKFQQIKEVIGCKTVSILDVGCGTATFLNICKNNGWNVQGVDPTKSSNKYASENYNILVQEEEFSEIKFDEKFDVITFWGVLEHLSTPLEAINKAKNLINGGGVIVFEVPSSDCFLSEYLKKYPFGATRYIESGRHNIFFSKKVIDIIAIEQNMEIALIETNGLDVQTILMEECGTEMTEKILNIQDIINDLLMGDHYRVFLKDV
jgi:2-polyprenyl-3-methyl-5-hydroxy-6-metoxy-1,4-benzoquinol methylase